jgi:sRNA-binding protein
MEPATERKPPASLQGPSDATAARIAASRARRVARDAAMAWLAATYPLAFGADVKPVAIGVGKLIWPEAKAAGIRRRALNDALSRASSLAYLEALAADGPMRVGLDGAQVEPISIEHQIHALDRLAEIGRCLGVKS